MGVTIDDIARAANVSTATVSRVINDNYPVSASARARVKSAIEQLGYRPNIFARGLMKAMTDSVGIVVPYLSNPYHTQIVDAIESELTKRDIFIYLCCAEDPKIEREYLQRLIHRGVDVLILVESFSMNLRGGLHLGLEKNFPVILVNEHLALDAPHHIVRCAQEPGLKDALNHFVDQGRKRIALLRGKMSYSFQLKEQLFKRFVMERRLVQNENPIIRIKDANNAEAVHEAAQCISELLKSSSPPDAVLAGNDLIGIGVLQGALAAGARVPEDLAIIGVDNTLISQISSPRLSSVDLQMENVGRITAETYFELRSSSFAPDVPIRRTIDSQFVQGGTS